MKNLHCFKSSGVHQEIVILPFRFIAAILPIDLHS
jgi:hypothetical protein